jgi:hypothetical protein
LRLVALENERTVFGALISAFTTWPNTWERERSGEEEGARRRRKSDSFFAFPGTRAVFKMFASLLDVLLDPHLGLGPGGKRDWKQRWRRRVRDESLVDLLIVLLQSRLVERCVTGRETESETETERGREGLTWMK